MIAETSQSVRAQRQVACIVVIGLAFCALLVMPGNSANPERFFYFKELFLAASALVSLIASVPSTKDLRLDRFDALALCFVSFSILSLLFAAGNKPFALRTASVLFSGIALFIVTRSLNSNAAERLLLGGASGTIIIVAIVVIFQAYTRHPNFSFQAGMPGGTFGNRNRAAHFLVLGMPSLFFFTYGLNRRLGFVAIIGFAICTAGIALTRTRGAWLGFIAEIITLALYLIFVNRKNLATHVFRRIAITGGVAAAAIMIVTTLPNSLKWHSSVPYTASASTLVDIGSPSAQIRLLQYRNTIALIRDHPVLGVGPGNWTVEYGKYASSGDPSYDNRFLVPTNRLPHGDWLGIAAEDGIVALLIVMALAVCIVMNVSHKAQAAGERRTALVCFATLAGAITMGLFDPVVLTPASCFLLAVVLGTCAPRVTRPSYRSTPILRSSAIAVGLFILSESTIFSVRQAWAQYAVEQTPSIHNLEKATRWDRGDFLSRMRLAQYWRSKQRCDLVRYYAGEAFKLRPTAFSAANLLKDCWSTEPPTLGRPREPQQH